MSRYYTLPLSDLNANLETVGGKGLSLAKLTRAGLPVPGGFHVTTQAYQRFVAASGLQPCILELLEGADPTQPDSLAGDHAADRFALRRSPDPARDRRRYRKRVCGHAGCTCRRALLCHCGRPAWFVVCRPDGNLYQHARSRAGSGCGQTLLGFAVDRPGDWLSGHERHRLRAGQPGGGHTGTRAGRIRRCHVHSRCVDRPARPGSDQRSLGVGGGGGRGAGHARYVHAG